MPTRMGVDSGMLVVRAAALVSLAVCGALVAEYGRTFPTYCSSRSGCAELVREGWGHVPLGADARVSVPVVGWAAFAGLFAATLRPAEARWRRAAVLGAIAAGAGGLALVLVQGIVIGIYCRLCVAVDVAAMVAAAGGVLAMVRPGGEFAEPFRAGAWVAFGLLAGLAPAVWPAVRAVPEAPAAVLAHHVPGRINVIELLDFACPHCRNLEVRLAQVNGEYGDRVHLVRVVLPLDGEPGSRAAARAYLCAEAQGRGDAMGAALLRASRLDDASLTDVAREQGCDLEAFGRCRAAVDLDAVIDRTIAEFGAGGFEGLPTLYVGHRKLVGTPSVEALRLAYAQAERGAERRGIPMPAYGAILLAMAFAIGTWGAAARQGFVGTPGSEAAAVATRP